MVVSDVNPILRGWLDSGPDPEYSLAIVTDGAA
jgi:hypothetical protein